MSDYEQVKWPMPKKASVGLAVSSFNTEIVDSLLEQFVTGMHELVKEHGVDVSFYGVEDDMDHVRVPGSLELPHGLAAVYNAWPHINVMVALGCVIRGDTSHYDIVCDVSSHALQRLSERHGVGVINGILTCENQEQAKERAVGRGKDFAYSALAMAKIGKVPTDSI